MKAIIHLLIFQIAFTYLAKEAEESLKEIVEESSMAHHINNMQRR